MTEGAVEAARRLADQVLLPDAAAVDAAERVPPAHLDALDAAGLAGHAASGADLPVRVDVTAALAGGCLATAFVWIQHQGALAAVARAPGPAARFAADLASGRLRAGVAITAVRPPRAPRLRQAEGGWSLSGRAPWVTGWGIVDVLRVAAIDDAGLVRTVLVDVGAGMTADPVRLVAANASSTVTLAFDEVRVPADRALDEVSPEEWAAADRAGLALNGALALGVAERAARSLESDALRRRVAEARAALLAADVDALPTARAECSETALIAAAALAVHDGGRGAAAGSRADRTMREAHFLLAFGMRPAITAVLRTRLAP